MREVDVLGRYEQMQWNSMYICWGKTSVVPKDRRRKHTRISGLMGKIQPVDMVLGLWMWKKALTPSKVRLPPLAMHVLNLLV